MVKVTVIATGFDRETADIQVEHPASRPTMVSVPAQIAARNSSVPPARAPAHSEDASPLLSQRRPAVPTRAPITVQQQVKSAVSTNFAPSSETDWDIPAFTRRPAR